MGIKSVANRLLMSSRASMDLGALARRVLFWRAYRSQARAHHTAPNRTATADAFRDKNILVLVPHPDDETMGCYFLIEAREAARIDLVYVTDGSAARSGHLFDDLPATRKAEAERARPASAIRQCTWWDLPDDELGTRETDLSARLDGVLAENDYDIVLSPAPADITPDHAVIGRVARDVCAASDAALYFYRSTWSTFGMLDADNVTLGRVEDKATAIAAFESQAYIPLLSPLLYSALEAARAGYGFKPVEAFISAERYAALPPYPVTNMLHWRKGSRAPLSANTWPDPA